MKEENRASISVYYILSVIIRYFSVIDFVLFLLVLRLLVMSFADYAEGSHQC